MSNYTLQQWLTDVKIESKNSGNTELDQWLIDVCNEMQKQYCALNQYVQLLVADATLNLTTNTELISLPSDLQHIKLETVKYYSDQFDQPIFLQKYDKYRNITYGWPSQVRRVANQLSITPFVQIATGDYLTFDYYNFPPTLVNPADTFHIPELIPVLKKEVVARASTFSDPKQYQTYKLEAKQAYIASQSVT